MMYTNVSDVEVLSDPFLTQLDFVAGMLHPWSIKAFGPPLPGIDEQDLHD